MLVRGFNSKDPKVKREALIKLRKAGYESQPVIDTGLVPDILLLLDSKDEEEKVRMQSVYYTSGISHFSSISE